MISSLDGLIQPFELVTTTVYFPVVFATYVCDSAEGILPPFLYQRYVEPAEEVNITEPSAQNIVAVPAVMLGATGNGLETTFTPTLASLIQPFSSITTTLYKPVVLAIYDRTLSPIFNPSLLH